MNKKYDSPLSRSQTIDANPVAATLCSSDLIWGINRSPAVVFEMLKFLCPSNLTLTSFR